MPAPLAALGIAGAAATAAATLLDSKAPMSLDRIKSMSEDFESVFLNGMLEEMFAGIDDDDPFANGEGTETWRSMQVEEFGRAIARSGGIGLAEHVQRHLLSLQETQS